MAQENVMKFIEMAQEDEALNARLGKIVDEEESNEDVSVILSLAEEVGLPFTFEELLAEMRKLDDDELDAVAGGGEVQSLKFLKEANDLLSDTEKAKDKGPSSADYVKAGVGVAVRVFKFFRMWRCFTGESLVSTPNGLKPIMELAIGDEVTTLDAQGQKTVGKIVGVLTPTEQEIVKVRFSNGKVWNTTPTQWYYCGNGEYNIAVNTEGRPALAEEGNVTVVKATMSGQREIVYDIKVDGSNIMFVNGVAAEGFSLH